jgi:hypothetical protein
LNISRGGASEAAMRETMMMCAVVMLTGCGATLEQLKTRAALDLDCTQAQLDVQKIDGGTRRVEGCGKRAIYVSIFNNSRDPVWLLNSDVRDVTAKSASR